MGKSALQDILILLLLFKYQLFYYSEVVFTSVCFSCGVGEAAIFSLNIIPLQL